MAGWEVYNYSDKPQKVGWYAFAYATDELDDVWPSCRYWDGQSWTKHDRYACAYYEEPFSSEAEAFSCANEYTKPKAVNKPNAS